KQGFFSGCLRSGVDDQGSGQLVSPLHEPRRDLTAGFRQHRRMVGRAALTGCPALASVLTLNCFSNLTNFFALLRRKLIPSTHLLRPPVQQVVRRGTKYSISQALSQKNRQSHLPEISSCIKRTYVLI